MTDQQKEFLDSAERFMVDIVERMDAFNFLTFKRLAGNWLYNYRQLKPVQQEKR